MRTKGSVEFSKRAPSPAQVAEEQGVTEATVSLWKSGQRKPVEVKRIALEEDYGVLRHWWDEPPDAPAGRAAVEVPELSPVTSLAEAQRETIKLANTLLKIVHQFAE